MKGQSLLSGKNIKKRYHNLSSVEFAIAFLVLIASLFSLHKLLLLYLTKCRNSNVTDDLDH